MSNARLEQLELNGEAVFKELFKTQPTLRLGLNDPKRPTVHVSIFSCCGYSKKISQVLDELEAQIRLNRSLKFDYTVHPKFESEQAEQEWEHQLEVRRKDRASQLYQLPENKVQPLLSWKNENEADFTPFRQTQEWQEASMRFNALFDGKKKDAFSRVLQADIAKYLKKNINDIDAELLAKEEQYIKTETVDCVACMKDVTSNSNRKNIVVIMASDFFDLMQMTIKNAATMNYSSDIVIAKCSKNNYQKVLVPQQAVTTSVVNDAKMMLNNSKNEAGNSLEFFLRLAERLAENDKIPSWRVAQIFHSCAQLQYDQVQKGEQDRATNLNAKSSEAEVKSLPPALIQPLELSAQNEVIPSQSKQRSPLRDHSVFNTRRPLPLSVSSPNLGSYGRSEVKPGMKVGVRS
jgi:hypothetical protein